VPSELRAAIIQPRLAAQHEIPLDDVRLPRTTLTDVPSLSARAASCYYQHSAYIPCAKRHGNSRPQARSHRLTHFESIP
jgi:hypothetical protein